MKRLNLILIGGAVIVWGVVFYQVLSSSEDGIADQGILPLPQTVASDTEKDTFKLIEFSRDPFLDKAVKRTHAKRKTPVYNNPVKRVKHKEPETDITWPQLAFHGVVENMSQGRTMGLLLINGKKRIVSQGDQLGEVMVKELSPQSIIVQLGKDTRTIPLQEQASM